MRGERFKDGLERSGPYDLELLGLSRWKCGYIFVERVRVLRVRFGFEP